MHNDPKAMEKEAFELLAKERHLEAFHSFKAAGQIYRHAGNHKEASLCFASAASCWAIKAGEKTFLNAAKSYEEAALQAKKAGDLEYAALLYKFAAVNFERDLEFINYSDSLFASRECYRRFLTLSIFCPKKLKHLRGKGGPGGETRLWRRILYWLFLSISAFFWGHGERPFRAFAFAVLAVFFFALIYTRGLITDGSAVFKPDFLQSFYFSVITFTTVGYGDFTPLGINRALVMLEAFCGLFTVPLFIVGLTRKYLRI